MPITFSHTFNFEPVGGTVVSGEIVFNHGQEPTIKIDSGITMTIEQLHRFHTMLDEVRLTASAFGDFVHLDIDKKV